VTSQGLLLKGEDTEALKNVRIPNLQQLFLLVMFWNLASIAQNNHTQNVRHKITYAIKPTHIIIKIIYFKCGLRLGLAPTVFDVQFHDQNRLLNASMSSPFSRCPWTSPRPRISVLISVPNLANSNPVPSRMQSQSVTRTPSCLF
jgi:hypothetical protein